MSEARDVQVLHTVALTSVTLFSIPNSCFCFQVHAKAIEKNK